MESNKDNVDSEDEAITIYGNDQNQSTLSDSTAKLLDLKRVKPLKPVVVEQKEPPSNKKPCNDNETRVITLDEIIRKGLNEQMPMTAKDIDNIVPNAIKEKEKQAEEANNMPRLEYSSDDDEEDDEKYTDSNDDKSDDNCSNENSLPKFIANKSDAEINKIEKNDHNADRSNLISMTNEEDNLNNPSLIKDTTDKSESNSVKEKLYSNKIDESKKQPESDSASEAQDTGTDTLDNSSKGESILKEQQQPTADESNMEMEQIPRRQRGRPKKIQINVEPVEKIKKKRGPKFKNPPYLGPKRKPGRPKREDAPSYTTLVEQNLSSPSQPYMDMTTPMDELRAMGHSLFSEYTPEKFCRIKKEKYTYSDDSYYHHNTKMSENTTTDQPETTIEPIENMLLVQQNVPAENTDTTILFRRKPGRPKIDRESGGHIVFQNSELTVVNRTNKLTGNQDNYREIQQQKDTYRGIVHHSTPYRGDVEIVPIPNTSHFMLPRETTVSAVDKKLSSLNNSYQGVTISSVQEERDSSMLIAPIDEMLEVHHVEDFAPQKKKRGRKPKYENIYMRNLYPDYMRNTELPVTSSSNCNTTTNTSTPPTANVPKKRGRKPKNALTPLNESNIEKTVQLDSIENNSTRITLKNINDLLESPFAQKDNNSSLISPPIFGDKVKRIRKPKIMDFPYEPPRQQVKPAASTVIAINSTPSMKNEQQISQVHASPNVSDTSNNSRDKRMSGNQPTYVEWSESSSDNHDQAAERQRQHLKNKTPLWKQVQSMNTTNVKLHWKTLKKLQEENLINSTRGGAGGTTTISPIGNVSNNMSSVDTDANNHQSSSITTTINDASEGLPLHTTVNTTGQQELLDNDDESEKRIPKLKFRSFNFIDRNNKYILKYKRKYKKRNSVNVQPPLGADGLPIDTSSQPPTHTYPGKKRGPKPKIRITEQLNPTVKRKWVRRTFHAAADAKRTFLDTQHNEENGNKRKHSEGGGTESESGEDGDKRTKRTNNDQQQQSTISNVYLENYNLALQDRNKVLLEIVEQANAEIRNLKLRLSNIPESVDKKFPVEAADTVRNVIHDTEGTNTIWTNAELCKAYSLQKLSAPFYKYCRDRYALPLPPASSVNKFIKNIHLTRGILPTMLQILELDGDTMSDLDRVCILQISEVNVNAIYEYDHSMDNVVGPYSTMTLVTAKGLYADWSQAVYINFNVTTFKQSLNLVIEELHKIKFNVVACVCQYIEGESNIWDELNVCMGCNYFSHPITTEFIYAFYYSDDLLLTIHKHFVTNGFTTDIGQPISILPIMQAISHLEKNNSKVHLNQEILIQNDILNAVHLFSKDTANIVRLCPTDKSDSTAHCTDFIDIVSSFYQLMNSKETYRTTSEINVELPFGRNLEFQNNILNEIQLNLFKLRCPGYTKMSAFQKATMMTIESLKMLQHSTKQKYKIDSFATHNITSDYFHNQFVHFKNCIKDASTLPPPPSPLEVFSIIKQIFLGCDAKDINVGQDRTDPSYENMFDGEEDILSGTKKKEEHYVDQLFQKLYAKYKEKFDEDPETFKSVLTRCEEEFLKLQNDHFKIVEGVVTKILKKVKLHIQHGMEDIVHTFILQRHLLRIKYLNGKISKLQA